MRLSVGHIKSLRLMDVPSLMNELHSAHRKKQFYRFIQMDFRLFIRSHYNRVLCSIINSADLIIPKGRLFTRFIRWISNHLIDVQIEENTCLSDEDDVRQQWIYYKTSIYDSNMDNAHGASAKKKQHVKPSVVIASELNISLLLVRLLHSTSVNFFFLGGKSKNLRQSANYLRSIFPSLKILGFHSARDMKKSTHSLLIKLKKLQPDIILIDEHSPKTYRWVQQYQQYMNSSICIDANFIRTYSKVKRSRYALFQFLFKNVWKKLFTMLYGTLLCLMLILFRRHFIKINNDSISQ